MIVFQDSGQKNYFFCPLSAKTEIYSNQVSF